jgi:hypothetical protein
MLGDFAVNKYLHTFASCWILLIQSYDARNHEHKKKVQKKPRRVVSMKGRSKICSVSSGERGVNTTAVCCVINAGYFVDCVWNVMAHAQKPGFVFRRNGRVHLNWRERQFSLLAAEVCASVVIMLDTPCSEVGWRVLANHSIRQFPLHFPSRASLCAITFQLDSTSYADVQTGRGMWPLPRMRSHQALFFTFNPESSYINKRLFLK